MGWPVRSQSKGGSREFGAKLRKVEQASRLLDTGGEGSRDDRPTP